jgi:hypothetical protein
MLRNRDDAEESASDRAFTRAISAWVLVLAILFWATTPSPENRSVLFSIRGSLDGDAACTGGKGECAEGREMICSFEAISQEFQALPAMVWKTWTDSKHMAEMVAGFAKEGKSQLTMQMVLESAEARDQNVGE